MTDIEQKTMIEAILALHQKNLDEILSAWNVQDVPEHGEKCYKQIARATAPIRTTIEILAETGTINYELGDGALTAIKDINNGYIKPCILAMLNQYS